MKTCTICRTEKPYSDFHRQASRTDGYANWCKPCKSKKKKLEYEKDRPRCLEKMAAYRRANPLKVSDGKKAARLKNIDIYNEKARQRYRDNRDSILEYMAKRRKEKWPELLAKQTKYIRERLRRDPLFRLTYSVRNRTFVALRDKGYGKKSRTAEMIGCDWQALSEHLQARFQEGMTMDNYGKWHVDHVVPLSSASSEEELIRLCHFTNLQPLWAADNIRKGARV